MDLLILIILLPIVGFGAFIFAKMQDKYFNVKFNKDFFKKSGLIVNFVSSDRKRIKKFPVQFNNSTSAMIEYKGRKIICEPDKLYDSEFPEKRVNIKNQEIVLFNEGTPELYLDEHSLQPLTFYSGDKPMNEEWFSSLVNAHIANQIAKSLASLKNFQTLIIICIILSLLSFALSFKIAFFDSGAQINYLKTINDNQNLMMNSSSLNSIGADVQVNNVRGSPITVRSSG